MGQAEGQAALRRAFAASRFRAGASAYESIDLIVASILANTVST